MAGKSNTAGGPRGVAVCGYALRQGKRSLLRGAKKRKGKSERERDTHGQTETDTA